MKTVKTWFSLMWKNGYIIGFLINIFFIVLMLIKKDDMVAYSSRLAFIIALAIPVIACMIIIWSGFIRFWQRFKKFMKFYEENANPG